MGEAASEDQEILGRLRKRSPHPDLHSNHLILHGINNLDPTFYLYRKYKNNISNYQCYITLVLQLENKRKS